MKLLTTHYSLLTSRGGYITTLALVFSAVFALLLSALTGFVFSEHRLQNAKEKREQALQIAEAGLDYYKWFLSHYANDLTNGTGEPGPYEHEVHDPEGGVLGTFSLEIGGDVQCGEVAAINITSTGRTADAPSFTRTVYGKHARPSVAEYAYILDSNVLAGADREIYGPYHSNYGIHMQGTNYSTVSSAVSTWWCTSSFGCSPAGNKPGVHGSGSGSALWTFPVPQINFAGISTDLALMQARATAQGVFYGPSGARGYHVVLRNNGTFDLYRVNTVNSVQSIHIDNTSIWQWDPHIITNETFLGNIVFPAGCRLAFFEDKVWVEGVVKGKITVAAADTDTLGVDPDIVLPGNITYTATDGSDGITVIAEHSIHIGPQAPATTNLRGIFIAQTGYFGHNLYPKSYPAYHHKTQLTLNGTIVSKGREGSKWTCGSSICTGGWSGFANRDNSYDRNLAANPPPLTPFTSVDYRFIEWREE